MSAQGAELRLSTPRRPAPRQLDAAELATIKAVADVLVPRAGGAPAATEDPDFETFLPRALSARADAFDTITDALGHLGSVDSDLAARLRVLSESDFTTFQALSAVIAGAWLMCPATQERIGYPGQRAVLFQIAQGSDEISEGILEPVLDRGEFFRPTPG